MNHIISRLCKCIFLIFLIPINSSAQNQVSDGLALMKIENSARVASLGGAFVAVTADANSAVINPATALGLTKFEISLGHTVYWENVRIESAYFAKPIKKKLFLHGGIKFATVDNLELRKSKTALPDGIFEAFDLSVKTGITYQKSDKLSFGISAGWFIEKIDLWRGSAFNIDLGVHAVVNDKLELGASILNLGKSFHLEANGLVDSDEITLPTTYRLGASYKYLDYLILSDIVISDDKFHLHLGTEKSVHESFKLRAGYMFNYDSKNLTAGAAFIHRNLTVDYAFVPYSNNLGTSHIFNLNFSL